MLEVFVADTLASNNENIGVLISPTGSATITGLIKRSTFDNSSVGMYLNGGSTSGRTDMTLAESSAAGNGGLGFAASSSNASANATLMLDRVTSSGNGIGLLADLFAIARITRSTFTRNGTGIAVIDAGTKVESFRDNVIRDNGTDIVGVLSPVEVQ